MQAQFIMDGDLLPVASKGDGNLDELLRVTAVAWTAEGNVKVFGYGLMSSEDLALPVLLSSESVEVWSRGTLR